jgi:hypothetical protein
MKDLLWSHPRGHAGGARRSKGYRSDAAVLEAEIERISPGTQARMSLVDGDSLSPVRVVGRSIPRRQGVVV